MPAAKPRNALSHMLSPLSEDELEHSAFDNTLDSNMENLDPTPKPRSKAGARSKAATSKATSVKVTKPRAPSRRRSGASTAAHSKSTAGRRALAERDAPNASETEEVDDFGEDEEEAATVKPRSNGVEYGFDGYPKRAEPMRKQAAKSRAKQSTRAPPKGPSSRYVPDTQPDPMDVEQSIEEITEIHDVPQPQQTRPHQRSGSLARHGSVQRQTSVPRSRAGSVSDREGRATDPALRRKLGDLTKKFENLDLKYKQLKDIAMRDTETNFDKLRRSTDQRAKDQDELIASLKRELASARSSHSDSKTLKAENASLKAETQRLSAEHARVTSEAKAQQTAVTEAQAEVKSLTAKLATARESLRVAEAAAAAAKIPGSAVKGLQKGAGPNASAMAGDTAVLKLKEELYSDLTGLMVRAVKKVEDEDVFDCIQTGRNGTLHFHLSVPPVPINADGSRNFDDAEFAYTPLLDEKNDRELLELLPDYLTEEICFPRSSAAKFYAKVLDSMTRKIVVEE